jgi:hypothetical protein
MVPHLVEAVKRYPEIDCHIHPISKIDAEIFQEMLELFKKMNFVAAVDILKNYKRVADEDVLEDIMELNTNVGRAKGDEADKDTPLFQRYIIIRGRRLDLFLLIGYDSVDLEHTERGIVPCIRLNPTPESAKQVPYYANEIIIFDSEEDREEILKKLDAYFELYRGIFVR